MKMLNTTRAAQVALIVTAISCTSTQAFADISDYRFELVDPAVKAGPDKIVTVRLMNQKTGKPVPGAVIFATRLDMAPDAMKEMVTRVTPVPGGEPGIYRFQATFETGTLENQLVITAQP
jgi:hypothetical protein